MKKAIQDRRIDDFNFKFSKLAVEEVLSKKQVKKDLDDLEALLPSTTDETAKAHLSAQPKRRGR